MDLNDVAVFVKVVQAGSFTQAAKLLDAPKSTVSAKVAALERRLGVTLLQRTTRKLSVTEEGDAFFRSCATALGEIEAAEALVSHGRKTPQGRIVVTASIDTGARFMPQFLKRFLAKYPDVEVSMILTNRYVDLVGEGVDVGIRAGELKDSSLMAKRLGTSYMALFAAPSYVRQHGEPQQPSELAQHACLRFSAANTPDWQLLKGKQRASVKVPTKLAADDLTTVKELAVHGHGIALLPTLFTHEDVQKKRLVRVLPEWHTQSHPLSLVYPAQRFQHARVRVFIDEIAAAWTTAFQSCDGALEKNC